MIEVFFIRDLLHLSFVELSSIYARESIGLKNSVVVWFSLHLQAYEKSLELSLLLCTLSRGMIFPIWLVGVISTPHPYVS